MVSVLYNSKLKNVYKIVPRLLQQVTCLQFYEAYATMLFLQVALANSFYCG